MRFSDAATALVASQPAYVAPGEAVVKLNQNESPYAPAPEEWASLLAQLAHVAPNRYPDPTHDALEDLIARRAGLSRDMALAGNGANELLELIVRSTCNPGDEVLTVAPTYHLYDRFCAMNRATLVKVPWGPGLAFPRSDLLAAISPRTRLVLLCRPNNPTGHIYPPGEVLAVTEAFSGVVAVDEAYHDFAQETVAPHIRHLPNLVVVRTLSKAYAAAGLRLGYLLAAADVASRVRSLQMPYAMGALSQAAALFLLSRPEAMERRRDAILAAREDLARRLDTVDGVGVVPSVANFLLVRTASSADALDRYLRSRRIFVRNLHWEDRYLRISVGTPHDHARLVAALRGFQAAGASA